MLDFLIVIVLYNKKIFELDLIKNKKFLFLIYDNSPTSQNYPNNIIYIHDPKNSGVSKAYNEGIKLAKELGKKYVLFLDQDTKFTLDMIEKYEKLTEIYGEDYIYTSVIGKENKIYSPFLEKNFRGRPQNKSEFKHLEVYNLDEKSIINSGMLVPLKIIDKIGTFNEKIKLDFSDMFFIDKYKKYKNEVILIDNFIEHSISGDEGKDKKRELNRFKFYCNGAKELYKSNSKRIKYTVFLRMGKLCLKYKSLYPLYVYMYYFWGEKKI